MHAPSNVSRRLAPCVVLAIVTLAACGESDLPTSTTMPIAEPTTASWVGCNASNKYTGGGRVDVDGIGKVTFGFNVDGTEECESGGGPHGNIEVQYHDQKLHAHSVTVANFHSFADPELGECGEFDGTARVKEGNGPWHEHHYFAEVCGNGEPGRSDHFSFYLNDHNNVIRAPLTGGNIQAHTR